MALHEITVLNRNHYTLTRSMDNEFQVPQVGSPEEIDLQVEKSQDSKS
jgi:hypothetical protein